MGVFWSSNLRVALKGPAEGRPAEGSPCARGSRKADEREMADKGVLSEMAEGKDTADRRSESSDAERVW